MRNLAVGLVVLAVTTLAACGGGSSAPNTNPLLITSTALPSAASGQTLNHVIPITGGYGGPYRLSVIAGRLPDGLTLDNATHSIVGTLLEAGTFFFRIQVIDVGGTPFQSTAADFNWNVTVGAVQIVDARPEFFPVGTQTDADGNVVNPDYPALPNTVYNQFASIQLVVAGGFPPYSCQLIDDPSNPDDGDLPQGAIIPADSCSIVGSPAEVRAGGAPFIITIEATDSHGSTGRLTMQWKITTPPIIIATEDLPDGRQGRTYTVTLIVAEGVPPFNFEFVACDVARDGEGEPLVDYQSPNPPVVTSDCSRTRPEHANGALAKIDATYYPPQDLLGPNYAALGYVAPPEGIFLGDIETSPFVTAGTITGIPRRRGDFQVNLHVESSLVPNEAGQQAWRRYEFSMLPPDNPLQQDPVYTLEDVFIPAPPYSTLPEIEAGTAFNPDVSSHPAAGLQLLAFGGVPRDGRTDAPHASQVSSIEGTGPGQEVPNTYSWTVAWDPDGNGGFQPSGLVFDSSGVLSVPDPNSVQRTSPMEVQFCAFDSALPVQLASQDCRKVSLSIGPDKVMITESDTPASYQFNGDLTSNDSNHKLRVLEPFTAIPAIIRDINSGDISPTHSLPATTGLAASGVQTLLEGMDILRIAVNPTGWWDDAHGLNPAGGRPFQHGDSIRRYPYQGSGSPDTSWQPNVTAVDLPDCTSPSVTHAPNSGVYTNGGNLYAFASDDYLGFFILRPDATVYVPAAFDRSTYNAMGDGWVQDSSVSDKNSMLRMPQISISPDGRFAAVKLRTVETNIFESAFSTKVLLFSLTGEKAFAGATYKILDTGSLGGSTTGVYQYGTSIALTNRYIYWLCGNNTGSEAAWHGHFIYRYEITNATGTVTAAATAGSFLAPNFSTNWTNNVAQPMQTAFHKFDSITSFQSVFDPSTSGFTQIEIASSEMYLYDGANLDEQGLAPMPFRVSRNGNVCAILAAVDPNTTFHANVMNHHVWADVNGVGLRQVSTAQRHSPQGGGRGYGLAYGPNSVPHWARYTGPTTGFEVSDDGSKIAVVVNRRTGSISSFSSNNWDNDRQDLIGFSTTDNWSTSAEAFISGNDAGSSRRFAGSSKWRFGSLVFTKDNQGLVFWAGVPWSPTNAGGGAHTFVGTFYSYEFSTDTLKSILPTADGGNSGGLVTYTTASPFNPSTTDWTTAAGLVKPVGGFLSRNRDFFYVTTLGALSTSKQTNMQVIGVNIRTLNNAASINGIPDGRAFAVSNWPAQRGFLSTYLYYPFYSLGSQRYFMPGRGMGGGMQVMAEDGGTVFFATHRQSNGPSNSPDSFAGGPHIPTYWGDYGGYSGEVYAMSADVGGAARALTSLGGGDFVGRNITYLESSNSGGELAFVYQAGNVSQYNYSAERVGYIRRIAFTSTGALANTPTVHLLESSNGRAGDSMAHGPLGDRLYYAYKSGISDEAQKELVEARISGSSTTPTIRRFATGNEQRFNVLTAGR
jgi:hypothetical protein